MLQAINMNNTSKLQRHPEARLREIFAKFLPEEAIVSDQAEIIRLGRDWITDFEPSPGLVLLPGSVEQVVQIVQICFQEGIAVVPSGGRTGLSGGATATDGEVVLSLSRMNRILEMNPIDRTITCQAGTVTQQLQDAALQAGFYFPVDFASKGSSQIGGNIATNAGGIRVIRYGNMRESILGLKVVTGTGELLELNGSLFKNQTGYDFRHLIIGSEGTLAIIVEATLKLVSPPGELIRLLCGFDTTEKILPLFERVRRAFRNVSAFEYFSPLALTEVMAHHQLRHPLGENAAAYAVIEFENGSDALREEIEQQFGSYLEDEIISDVIISQNSKQADDILKYRELISETLSSCYTLHKNDISVPVASIPAFVKELEEETAQSYPGYKVVIFGHIGDGNLHVNVLKPAELDRAEFFSFCKSADQILFSLVRRYKGSISAEHGVGLLKRDFLEMTRPPVEIELMRQVKKAFDPKGILNPGKIFR